MDVFISYRRDTGDFYASKIYDLLTSCKLDVFLDKKNFYQYKGEFPSVLHENIEACEYFILLLSDLDIDDFENSIYIQEIITALELKKPIIIVQTKFFKYPENLYEPIQVLPRLQTIEISDSSYFEGDFLKDLLAKMTDFEKGKRAYNRLVACSKLESRKTVEARSSLTERFNDDVFSVDMCGIACRGLLSNAREHFEKVIAQGGKIRIVINKPNTPAAEDAYTKKLSNGSLRQRSRVIPQAYDELCDWIYDNPNNFEGRVTEEFLPCAILIIRTKNNVNNTIKVDYYGFDCPDTERRCIMINSKDEDNFDFYVKQFEWVWNNAEVINLEDV